MPRRILILQYNRTMAAGQVRGFRELPRAYEVMLAKGASEVISAFLASGQEIEMISLGDAQVYEIEVA